jgi:hypothetical protein
VDYRHRLVKLPPTEHLRELYGARHKHVDPLARRGTEVHKLAEKIVTRQPVEVPEALRGHLESYAAFVETFRVEPVAVELVIVNREVGYCGTADLIAHVAGWGVTLLELKTGESGIWPEAALQATGYEHGETFAFVGETDEHDLAGLGIESAAAVHVRADGYDYRPLNTGPEVWAYFCRLAANHREQDTMREWVGEAVEPLGVTV